MNTKVNRASLFVLWLVEAGSGWRGRTEVLTDMERPMSSDILSIPFFHSSALKEKRDGTGLFDDESL